VSFAHLCRRCLIAVRGAKALFQTGRLTSRSVVPAMMAVEMRRTDIHTPQLPSPRRQDPVPASAAIAVPGGGRIADEAEPDAVSKYDATVDHKAAVDDEAAVETATAECKAAVKTAAVKTATVKTATVKTATVETGMKAAAVTAAMPSAMAAPMSSTVAAAATRRSTCCER
jgi:hypothetical protein